MYYAKENFNLFVSVIVVCSRIKNWAQASKDFHFWFRTTEKKYVDQISVNSFFNFICFIWIILSFRFYVLFWCRRFLFSLLFLFAIYSTITLIFKTKKRQQQIESSYDLRNLQQSMWLFTYRTLTLFSLFALTLFQFIGRCWILSLSRRRLDTLWMRFSFLLSLRLQIRWICLQTIYFLVLHAIHRPIPLE